MQIERTHNNKGQRVGCVVLASVAQIIEARASRPGRSDGLDAGSAKVLSAVQEALQVGIDQIDIALVLGASPIDRFLADNPAVGESAAKAALSDLQRRLSLSGLWGRRVRFLKGGAPLTAAAAIGVVCRRYAVRPVVVLAPQEMREVSAACLSDLLAERHGIRDETSVIAAAVTMDDLPRIDWLACRGRKMFARNVAHAADSPSDLSELRMIGRCVLSAAAAAACAQPRSKHGRAATLGEILNLELSSGRRVAAIEFKRASSMVDHFARSSNIVALPNARPHRNSPLSAAISF